MNLDDLPDDDQCLHCGAELPKDRHLGRRKYCSHACCTADYRAQEERLRARRKEGRVCEGCGQPVPHERGLNATYCSEQCKVKSLNDLRAEQRREARSGRTCAWCGGPIPDHKRAGTITCSRACTVHLSNDRAKRRRRESPAGT
jgi:predicted nucleic acid-binding Zn ribbon protein